MGRKNRGPEKRRFFGWRYIHHSGGSPGTYSLTASSEEERIARNFILDEHPDLVIVVVDAANLERSLYLLAEVLLLSVPVILALNMMYVAGQEGIQVEPAVLESALGISVAPMSAAHNQGIEALIPAIQDFIDGRNKFTPKKPSISAEHRGIQDQIVEQSLHMFLMTTL
jgi:ferrous iron transport protein B